MLSSVEITAFRPGEQIFPPTRALEFITGHVIYNTAYTYKFQLKTTKDIEPNSVAEYTMNGYGEVQLFDLSWDMKNNLGYVALENGNGRITIMSMPYMSNFKV